MPILPHNPLLPHPDIRGMGPSPIVRWCSLASIVTCPAVDKFLVHRRYMERAVESLLSSGVVQDVELGPSRGMRMRDEEQNRAGTSLVAGYGDGAGDRADEVWELKKKSSLRWADDSDVSIATPPSGREDSAPSPFSPGHGSEADATPHALSRFAPHGSESSVLDGTFLRKSSLRRHTSDGGHADIPLAREASLSIHGVNGFHSGQGHAVVNGHSVVRTSSVRDGVQSPAAEEVSVSFPRPRRIRTKLKPSLPDGWWGWGGWWPILSRKHWLRRWALALCRSNIVDTFVTYCILLNCVSLAIYQPNKPKDYIWNVVAERAELAFVVVFTLEMATKLLATGLYSARDAYLRTYWNWLDGFIVIIAWVSYLPGAENYSGLRGLRLLRTLRAVRRNKKLKVLVETLIDSIKPLANVFALWMFLLYHCVEADGYIAVGQENAVCRRDSDCDVGQSCRNQGPDGHLFSNPDFGLIGFDNLGYVAACDGCNIPHTHVATWDGCHTLAPSQHYC
eukprot:jgi/Mesvir1/29010/Mv06927-RA.1